MVWNLRQAADLLMLIKLGTKTQFYIKMIIENHIKGEEKMSKLSRKLVLSVLTLVLSVVALGTTTFAWFALGQSATIDQFQLQATAGEGLEINFNSKREIGSTDP